MINIQLVKEAWIRKWYDAYDLSVIVIDLKHDKIETVYQKWF